MSSAKIKVGDALKRYEVATKLVVMARAIEPLVEKFYGSKSVWEGLSGCALSLHEYNTLKGILVLDFRWKGATWVTSTFVDVEGIASGCEMINGNLPEKLAEALVRRVEGRDDE